MPDDPIPTLNKFLEDKEYEYVQMVLQVSNGNIKRAANIAGRHWCNFYKKKIRAYGFHPKEFRKQRGFSTLIVYGLLALAALAALGGIYGAGYRSGGQAKQVQWDEANRTAQEKADEERRGREAMARAESAKLGVAQARARDFETRWRAARANAGSLAAVECPAASAEPAGSVPAPLGGLRPPAPVVRVTAAFVGLWDGAWTGQDGQPVFRDPGGPSEKANTPGPTIGAVLDNHAENAGRCSETSRQLNGLIDLIEKLRAR